MTAINYSNMVDYAQRVALGAAAVKAAQAQVRADMAALKKAAGTPGASLRRPQGGGVKGRTARTPNGKIVNSVNNSVCVDYLSDEYERLHPKWMSDFYDASNYYPGETVRLKKAYATRFGTAELRRACKRGIWHFGGGSQKDMSVRRKADGHISQRGENHDST